MKAKLNNLGYENKVSHAREITLETVTTEQYFNLPEFNYFLPSKSKLKKKLKTAFNNRLGYLRYKIDRIKKPQPIEAICSWLEPNKINSSEALAQIKVSFTRKNQINFKITKSEEAYEILTPLYNKETLEYQESFYVLFLNRASKVLGWYNLSNGTTTACLVDKKIITGIAINCNAQKVIISHNHPSGSLTPSKADITITKEVKEALKLFDIHLLDHIIISSEGYHSLADNREI